MITIKEKDLINLPHVVTVHAEDDEEEHFVNIHIIVEPHDDSNEEMKLDFHYHDEPTHDDKPWEVYFDVEKDCNHHEFVVGSQEILVNNVELLDGSFAPIKKYQMLIFKMRIEEWANFKPVLKINGEIPRSHDGTIHKPSDGDG